MIARSYRRRIDEPGAALERVAAGTGVNQIRIVAYARGIVFLRNDVIDRERRGAVRIPHFPLKARNATENELVAQPRLEVAVIRVSGRRVFPHVWRGRINESDAPGHSSTAADLPRNSARSRAWPWTSGRG